MCQFSRSATAGPGLDVTVADHMTGVRQASFRTDPDSHGLVLGELDDSNRDVIDAVVRRGLPGSAGQLGARYRSTPMPSSTRGTQRGR